MVEAYQVESGAYEPLDIRVGDVVLVDWERKPAIGDVAAKETAPSSMIALGRCAADGGRWGSLVRPAELLLGCSRSQ